MTVSVETTIAAPAPKVWKAWTTSDDIIRWNAASDDWHTTEAELDLRVGGLFRYRMEAKDGSIGFDFDGTFTSIKPTEEIAYTLGDGRQVLVTFTALGSATHVRETFDPGSSHDADQQRAGWQAILDSFKRHVEALPPSN